MRQINAKIDICSDRDHEVYQLVTFSLILARLYMVELTVTYEYWSSSTLRMGSGMLLQSLSSSNSIALQAVKAVPSFAGAPLQLYKQLGRSSFVRNMYSICLFPQW